MANNIDRGKRKFPRRRKFKDNPYTIGYDEEQQSYFLTFSNASGIIQQIYIAQELYEVFDGFELDDLSQLNEQERHIDASELTEEYLYKNLSYLPNVVEEMIDRKICKEVVQKAIKTLSPTQRRRLILYFFEDFTFEQIAEIEACSPRAIKYSVDCAKQNLKKYFKKF